MSDIDPFFHHLAPSAHEYATWGNGTLPLHLTTYLTAGIPPLSLVTSVRSLVFRDHRLLVLRNADSTHILPGGRCEQGESLETTLRREVLEESGWTIANPILLGCIHFRHLAPKPAGYRYPHPQFVQVVFCAQADGYDASARLADDYEIDAQWYALDAVRSLALSPGEQVFLDAALRTLDRSR